MVKYQVDKTQFSIISILPQSKDRGVAVTPVLVRQSERVVCIGIYFFIRDNKITRNIKH